MVAAWFWEPETYVLGRSSRLYSTKSTLIRVLQNIIIQKKRRKHMVGVYIVKKNLINIIKNIVIINVKENIENLILLKKLKAEI